MSTCRTFVLPCHCSSKPPMICESRTWMYLAYLSRLAKQLRSHPWKLRPGSICSRIIRKKSIQHKRKHRACGNFINQWSMFDVFNGAPSSMGSCSVSFAKLCSAYVTNMQSHDIICTSQLNPLASAQITSSNTLGEDPSRLSPELGLGKRSRMESGTWPDCSFLQFVSFRT